MPVAKTYANLTIQGEPFCENKRMYVNVLAKNGIKKVRWYSDAEYRRMYPDAAVENDIMDFDARHAFGFGDEGYITIYKGRNVEEWAENDRHNIWRNLTFDYYTPGRLGRLCVSEGIEPIKLYWEQVAAEGNKMKPHDEVRKIVLSLLQDNSDSQYQGQVDEWLQKEVTVQEKKSRDSRYGTKYTYRMTDSDDNVYSWETGAKDYAIGTKVQLKMKVKAHEELGGEKVTVVWYCKEM